MKLIYAVANNNVIGKDNGLPWKLRNDMIWFKKMTLDHIVIMGRKTFDSIGKVLPGRLNIVVTQGEYVSNQESLIYAHSVEHAIHIAKGRMLEGNRNLKDWILLGIVFIGGSSIYEQALPYVNTIYKTEINSDIEGDAFFPEYDESQWECKYNFKYTKAEGHEYDHSCLVLRRITEI